MSIAYSLTEQAMADAVAKLDTIRADTIEECARVAEVQANWNFEKETCERIAAAIRALKDKP